MKKQSGNKQSLFQRLRIITSTFFRNAYEKVKLFIKSGYFRTASVIAKHYLFLRDVLFINILLFTIILVLGLITFNISFFDPFKQAFKDFSFANVYFSKMADTTRVDTNIILVNTGVCSRKEIATLITKITKYHPKVIGIDHFFIGRKPDDSLLALSIKNAPLVIGVCKLTDYSDGEYSNIQKSDPFFPMTDYGFVNYPAEDPAYSTIRHTRFLYVLSKDTIYSFPVAIIQRFDSNGFERAKPWFNKFQIINYLGNQRNFITIDTRDISDSLEDLSIVKDKIVLLGYMGDSLSAIKKLEDFYFTPVNKRIAGRTVPDMYGVVIHANTVSMILNHRFIYSVPFFFECIFSFIITFLYLLIIVSLFRKDHKYYELYAFIIQYVSSAILLFIYFILFAKTSVSFNMTLAIIGLVSMKFVISLYFSLIKFFNRFFEFKTSLNI
jgi:CHASE2 domain-containing sensor protein